MILDHDSRPNISERKVRDAFRCSGLRQRSGSYQYDWEHGQWWVTDKLTGRTWGVVETSNGLDFDLIAYGDER